MAPLQIYEEASSNLRDALQAANCSFCTIGEIPLRPKSPLTLLFKDTDGKGGVLELPPVAQDDILPLLEACKQAPFGRGSETVLDPTYRRALVLPAEKFAVSPAAVVDPYTIGILDEISRHLLNRSDRRIIARLDKMNVYGPGDFFKGHIDTPKSSDMFGTLLINLPVAHEGGELVVFATNAKDSEPDAGDTESSAHVAQGKVSAGSGPEMKHTTNWGATDCLSWIAFFSDCPHEVLPVESGHRVTLSFDLIYDGLEVNNEGDQLKLEIIDRLASALTTDVVLNATSPFFGTHLQHRYVRHIIPFKTATTHRSHL
ncbi:hypothetical protein DL93DRAFT_1435838 [Clavulina sp. PMI_390]|nr:hypothetical protein DL93DRAFT_1435838 [Clavulina sp. PMI_390]